MVQNKLMFAGLILLGSASACAGSHAEQVQDARMAQAESNAEAREGAVEDQAKARNEAIDQRYESLNGAAAESGAADSKDTEKLIGLSKDRAEYQSNAQERLDKLHVSLDAAQQKISVLGDRAPTKLRTELMTARQDHQTLATQLNSLRSARSPNWDADKDQMDQRISELKDRVSKLSDQIADAAG